jgi:Secretion system C-terminal sorting domain
MKKYTLFILALLCLYFKPLFAQVGLEEQVEEALSTLDYNEVNTGILYEKIPSYLDFQYFDGSYISDSTVVTPSRYLLMYGMIDKAHTGLSPMLPIDRFWDIVDSLQNTDTIQLSLMYFRYDRFKPYALDSNLVVYQDSHFYDVPNRPESPYQEDTLFASCLMRNVTTELQVVFQLSADMLYSNVTGGFGTLEADFDEGSGWQQISAGQKIAFTYPDTGLYRIKLRQTLSGGQQLLSQSLLQINEPPPNPPPPNPPPDGYPDEPIPLTGNFSGVDLYYFPNQLCEDEIIRKPLIVFEGFDPNHIFGSDRFRAFLKTPGLITPTGNFLIDDFHEEGYDLFFVNWQDGGLGDIIEKTQIAKDIIRQINEWKQQNGSTEKNVVLGASMGGLIGKWALREMELAGEDHETELLISFDSPLKGNNLPLGMQALIGNLANWKFFGKKLIERKGTEKLKAASELLNSPAAKQLLFYHTNANSCTSCQADWLSIWHDAFYAQFESLGDLDITHVAISNGAVDNTIQLFSAGTKLLDINNYFYGIGDSPISLFNLNLKVWALPDGGQDKKVFEADKWIIILGIPFYTGGYKEISGALPYDSSPGGMREFDGDEPETTTGLGFGKFFILDWNFTSFSFAPTISGLGMNVPHPYFDASDVETLTGNGTTSLRSYVGSNMATTQFGITQVNQEHVSLNSRNATFMIYYILDGYNLQTELINGLLDDRTYNFGETEELISYSAFDFRKTKDVIDYDITVSDIGKLWVNRTDIIGFTDEMNPLNSNNSHFDLYIREHCVNGETTVILQNSGEMLIGDWDGSTNTASVYIEDGATILIKNGGFAEVDQNSKIIVNQGGTLKIESGGRLRATEGGQIIIEEGGTLEIDGGANIDLFWNASNIHVKGELIINGTFNFDGYGYFQFDNTHTLTLNADFVLSGQGSSFIKLNAGTELNIGNRLIDLNYGKVEYANNTKIDVGQGGRVNAQSVEFIGLSGAPDNNIAFDIGEASDITFISCSFENLSAGVNAVNNFAAPLFQVYTSQFENCAMGIYADGFQNINVNGTDFLPGATSGSVAVSFTDVNLAGLNSGSVKDYTTNNSDIGAIYLDNVDDMYLTGVTIENNEVGVFLEDVTSLRVFGGQINGNTIAGIRAPLTTFSGGANESNVFLFSEAQVNNNATGIEIEKGGENSAGDYYGMVLMDCAELVNNTIVGITGDDVILQIDAYMNCGCNDAASLRPNKIYGNTLEFDICYIGLSSVVSTVSAKGNYWGGGMPTNYWVNNQTSDCATQGGILDASMYVTTEPTSCDDGGLAEPDDPPVTVNPGFTGNTSEMCTLNIGGSNRDLHEEFIDAYDHYRAGWYALAGQKFTPIAAITGNDHLNASAMCKQYINVAKVMANSTTPLYMVSNDNDIAQSQGLTLGLDKTEEKDIFSMKIYPNPAKSQFIIELEDGDFEIKIFDLLGVEKYFTKRNSSAEISTVNWPSGIYLIEVFDLQSKKQVNGKVVVR